MPKAEVATLSALTRRRSRPGRTCSSLLSARTEVSSIPAMPARGRGPQPHRHGDRLGVVEQKGRQLAAGAQPVAAGDPGRGLDRIPEGAQFVDVAPDRARADLEPVGQLLAGPFPAHLEQ